jgi:hypothetical protein
MPAENRGRTWCEDRVAGCTIAHQCHEHVLYSTHALGVPTGGAVPGLLEGLGSSVSSMSVAPQFGTAAQSLAYARARDDRIAWLLNMHPVTASMLVAIGWFPSRARALKRLRRLVAKGRIRFVGTASRKFGRPEYVFCRWRVKADDVHHEVELTELCFHLDAARILRGPHITDTTLRPDAEVWINGKLHYLELDRGTMGFPQMDRRFELYESCPHFVLWVCPTVERREGLRMRAQRLRAIALFTTYAQAVASPHKEIWIDYAGDRVSLPRQGK